jgi:hypothetical protein
VRGVKGTACAGYVLQPASAASGVQYNGGERLVLAEITVGIGFRALRHRTAAGRYFEDFSAGQTPKGGTVPGRSF